MTATSAQIPASQTATQTSATASGAGKASAGGKSGDGFDAMFATMLAAHAADDAPAPGKAVAGDASKPDGAKASTDTVDANATGGNTSKEFLQALNNGASPAALDAAAQAADTKPKADGKAPKSDQANGKATGKGAQSVAPEALAHAADAAMTAGLRAAEPKPAKAEDGQDHKTAKAGKDSKDKAEQPSATILAALGVPAAQASSQIPAQTQPAADGKANPAQDVSVDGATAKQPAANTNAADTQTPSAPKADAAEAQPAAAKNAAENAADSKTTQTANAGASTGPKNSSQPATPDANQKTASTAAGDSAAEAALKNVLAALGVKGAPAAAQQAVAANAASNGAKPAPGKTEKTAAAKPAQPGNAQAGGVAATAPGQAVAAAQNTANTSSDNGGRDGGKPSMHGNHAAHAPNAKTALHAPQFHVAHNSAATSFAADPNATASTFAAQGANMAGAASNAVGALPTHLAAQVQVTPQAAVQAQQPVPAGDFGALALNIASHSKNGAQHFSIALHPADLGSIHVALSVDHTGQAQAHLSAENQQTLQLLQQNGHHLERALKDTGLNLAGGGLNFSLKSQQQQQNQGGRQSGQGRGRALSVSAVASAQADTAAAANAAHHLMPGSARLDIQV